MNRAGLQKPSRNSDSSSPWSPASIAMTIIRRRKVFAETIREIRRLQPDCSVEVLIPYFQGREDCLQIVLDAQPES